MKIYVPESEKLKALQEYPAPLKYPVVSLMWEPKAHAYEPWDIQPVDTERFSSPSRVLKVRSIRNRITLLAGNRQNEHRSHWIS
ncbi:hypothetical protein CYMTET_39615 [Cymbomonas tetramitiformis]|uniref:Uncharacterized protein n=1 Tax=Cymbomonas tetramitiformis TaxID=36881 RepID=A0AAE0C9R9_9CHLO|nr:hypothetical protein CYMTET_39615 [Cymbomonas tetramitiformis]